MKHQNLILVAVIGAFGRYGNVTVAHLNAEKSTADGAVYDVPVNTTPTLPPHTAPEGKDWLYAPDTSDGWVLADDYADVVVYDIRTAQRIAPPEFNQPLAEYMTLIEPQFDVGMVTYWDDETQAWAMRDDLTGKQVFSTADPRQSLVLGREDWAVPQGYTEKPAPSLAHVWDAKKGDWLLDKTKQAELDQQAAAAAFEQAKIAKTSEINTQAQAYIDHATGADQLPAFEVQSWAIQGAEAKAWHADSTAPTPTLDAIAKARCVPLDALRAGAYKKTMMYEAVVASVMGQRQKYNDQLRAAKTLTEIDAINVVYG